MDCFAGFEPICQADVPLAAQTWYGLGGPARWMLSPRDEAELAAVLRRCAERGIPWRILGRGANVLVNDGGVQAAVIRLVGPSWEKIIWEDDGVYAAGGADFPELVKACVARGLAGLENLAGIPGTVGGVVRMNAGGRHGEVGRYLTEIRFMESSGRVLTLEADRITFGYRRTNLPAGVVLGARFGLRREDPAVVAERYRAVWQEKSAGQPPMGSRSAGCVFKNPVGVDGKRISAGRLIDAAGLKGLRVGGAWISPRHANFVIAGPDATAQDVLNLMMIARERVARETGIELEPEVELW